MDEHKYAYIHTLPVGWGGGGGVQKVSWRDLDGEWVTVTAQPSRPRPPTGANNADAEGVMERLGDEEWVTLAPQPSHHHHHHPHRPAPPPFLCQLTIQLPGQTDRQARAGESREVTWRSGSCTPDAYLHAATKDFPLRPDNTTQRDRAFPRALGPVPFLTQKAVHKHGHSCSGG